MKTSHEAREKRNISEELTKPKRDHEENSFPPKRTVRPEEHERFEMEHYCVKQIYVKLEQLVIPHEDYRIRHISESHVKELQEIFRCHGIVPDLGLITITFLRATNANRMLIFDDIIERWNGVDILKSGLQAHVVDGAHRVTALLCLKRTLQAEWIEEPFKVSLLSRKDQTFIPQTHFLRYSFIRNDMTSKVKKDVSFCDRIHGVCTFTRAFAGEMKMPIGKVDMKKLVECFGQQDFFRKNPTSEATIRKYVKVAVAFEKFPGLVKRLVQYFQNKSENVKGVLSCSHIRADYFNDFVINLEEAWLSLECVVSYVMHITENCTEKTYGAFDSESFYNELEKMMSMIRATMSECRSDSIKEFLQCNLGHSETRRSLREVVIASLKELPVSNIQKGKKMNDIAGKVKLAILGVYNSSNDDYNDDEQSFAGHKKRKSQGQINPKTTGKLQGMESFSPLSFSDSILNNQRQQSKVMRNPLKLIKEKGNRPPLWPGMFKGNPVIVRSCIPRNKKGNLEPLLRALQMEKNHKAYDILRTEDVIHLHCSLWKQATALEERKKTDFYYRLKKNLANRDLWSERNLWSNAIFVTNKAALEAQGFCILENLGDFAYCDSGELESVTRCKGVGEFFKTPFEEVFQHYLLNFEKERKSGFGNGLWQSVVTERNGKGNSAIHCGPYSSTTILLEKTGTENAWIEKKRTILDVWIGLIFAGLEILNGRGQPYGWIPASGGRFIVTSEGSSRQASRNEFDHGKHSSGDSPGYFCIINGEHAYSLWVIPGSHNLIKYTELDRKRLSQILKLQKINVPARSVFIGHGHLSYASAGWEDW